MACKMYINREGMKTQEDYPAAEVVVKKDWKTTKERLEDYSTSVA